MLGIPGTIEPPPYDAPIVPLVNGSIIHQIFICR
jgi:hypothetical protein